MGMEGSFEGFAVESFGTSQSLWRAQDDDGITRFDDGFVVHAGSLLDLVDFSDRPLCKGG